MENVKKIEVAEKIADAVKDAPKEDQMFILGYLECLKTSNTLANANSIPLNSKKAIV